MDKNCASSIRKMLDIDNLMRVFQCSKGITYEVDGDPRFKGIQCVCGFTCKLPGEMAEHLTRLTDSEYEQHHAIILMRSVS